jgi:hypothetical protein
LVIGASKVTAFAVTIEFDDARFVQASIRDLTAVRIGDGAMDKALLRAVLALNRADTGTNGMAATEIATRASPVNKIERDKRVCVVRITFLRL